MAIILIALTVALGIYAVILALHWPFSRERVTQALQEDFPATVTFSSFHSTYFPHPGCVAEGLVFTRLGSLPGTPAIVTIQRFTVLAHYFDILLRPGHLSRIVLQGFRLQLPRPGTPVQPSNWHETKSTTVVGEIIADGAVIEAARANSKPPLRFDIHALKLSSVSRDKRLSYNVSLNIPLPPGEIQSQGQFGPWNSAHPGDTPVAGQYTFQNADLAVFHGLAGTLSAQDKFQGVLRHIETRGTIDIPDFMLTRAKHTVHLVTDFHAFVDGTKGDVEIERVNAGFLHTRLQASGKIAGHPGEHGKTTSIDLSVQNGRIQDFLRLFVREPKPPLNGVTSFRAHVLIPPEQRPFLQKVRLTGDFGIADGQFTKVSRQKDIDILSEKARGEKPDPGQEEDSERVISNLAGHVELRNAAANFTDLSFNVPGAFARMHGTYNLQSEVVNLHGTLKTDAQLSKMATGLKSVLLKPFDPFFKKDHSGAVVPVHLIGTYHDPEAGLDLLPQKSSAKASAAGN